MNTDQCINHVMDGFILDVNKYVLTKTAVISSKEMDTLKVDSARNWFYILATGALYNRPIMVSSFISFGVLVV